MKPRIFLTTFTAIALAAAAPAFAADYGTGRSSGSSHATGSATQEHWMQATTLHGNDLIGADVVDASGKSIGEISDLVFQIKGGTGATSTGAANATAGGARLANVKAIVSVGEFLGMGGHKVAIPLDKLTVQQQSGDHDKVRARLDMSKSELKSMPAYEKDRM